MTAPRFYTEPPGKPVECPATTTGLWYHGAAMKTDLDHLAAREREPIAAIAALIQASAPVEMIILFGSRARGDWVKDPVTGYESDVDVLVIVASEEVEADYGLWARV